MTSCNGFKLFKNTVLGIDKKCVHIIFFLVFFHTITPWILLTSDLYNKIYTIVRNCTLIISTFIELLLINVKWYLIYFDTHTMYVNNKRNNNKRIFNCGLIIRWNIGEQELSKIDIFEWEGEKQNLKLVLITISRRFYKQRSPKKYCLISILIM